MGRNNRQHHPQEDRIVRRENRGDETVGLMEFVAGFMPDAKRNDLKKWLKYGHLMVDGIVSKGFDTPVDPGSLVELNLSRPFVTFQHRRLEMVYEDDDIIVVNKGYGLLSVGTGRPGADGKVKKEETAYNILKDYVKQKNPANKIFVVHRLDRDTSGLMMFAKSIEAQTAMQHNWNNMVLSRKYVAVVEGVVEAPEGVIESNLEETGSFHVYSTHEQGEGKKAVTRYKVLQRGRTSTLVEFNLDTGRKNQIRVHASDIGHPIVGDRKYGAAASSLHRLALHARSLSFAHPMTRKYMNFETPIPTKFIGFVRHS